MTKTEKTSKKTTAAKTAKTTAKKSEKLDMDTFTVNQPELATILGLATPNITAMIQNGNLVKDSDGRFNLRDSVSGYCKRLRERKGGVRSKTDIDTETAKLKLDNLRIKNRDWRMQRDRQVATEILSKLAGAMMTFRDMAKLNPALVDAIDELVSSIQAVNVDDIAVIIEGEDEEDDD